MELRNICKSYSSEKVFENFSLRIDEGEILCVLGESGGGKTTLLNILAGVIPFEGERVGVPDRVSYIFQEERLLPNLTVRKNLIYACGKSDKIDDMLEKVELSAYADKRPSELSGGQKQRVSIARAFLRESGLLLMDEPFSSLDTAMKIRLSGVFAKLWKDRKMQNEGGRCATSVFVTHDIEEALMLADRIVVIKKGEIKADFRLDREKLGFPAPYAMPSEYRDRLMQILLHE